MATKTVALKEDVYLRLRRLKAPGETFSDVVGRLAGREDLSRFIGVISPEFGEELLEFSRRSRRGLASSVSERKRGKESEDA